MSRPLIVLGLCLAVVAGNGGCARMAVQERVTLLGDETRAYRKAMRWGAYDLATQLVRRRDGTVPSYDKKLLDGIRVVSFEITGQDMDPSSGEAIVSSQISYYHIDSGRVRTIKDRQVWWYDEVTEHWYIDGDLPDFAAGLGSN